MKKRYFVFLLVISILFIAGCKDGGTSAGSFIGGDQGLELSFVVGEPPETVLDNHQDPFDITVLLKNKGEADIKRDDIIVTLQGISKDDFGVSSLSRKNIDALEGRERFGQEAIEVDETEVRFTSLNYLHDLNADFDVDIRADVCYEYSTKAVTSLCLKKDATKRKTQDACEVNNDAVAVDNSGAPIKVKSMRQRASGSNQIKFTFDIEKIAAGDIFEPGTFKDKCEVDEDKKDRVLVEVTSAGNLPITCSRLDGTRKVVDLIGEKRTISCNVNTAGLQDTAFLRRIRLDLSYMFKDSKTTPLTIADSQD